MFGSDAWIMFFTSFIVQYNMFYIIPVGPSHEITKDMGTTTSAIMSLSLQQLHQRDSWLQYVYMYVCL